MANVLAQGAPKPANANSAAPTSYVSFTRASGEHRESAFDISRQLTTSDQDLGVIDVPAYGWARSIVLVVTATGGVGAAVTAREDAPFNALKTIMLSEPNGTALHSFDTGYDLYLANKWGGYRNSVGADPRQSPVYSAPATAGGNFSFLVRIPIELNARDGLGSLANQSAAATFKLRLSLAALAQVYGTVPTTAPTVRIQGWLEAWDQPEASVGGQANQLTPPAPDSAQYYSSQVFNIAAGQQTVQVRRVGNYIRGLTLIYRAVDGTRASAAASWASPVTLYLDTRPIDQFDIPNVRHQMFERTGFGANYGVQTAPDDTPGGLDRSVVHYDFAHEVDGSIGHEFGDLWLPTQTSTRLELSGNFGAAGTLKVMTNDISLSAPVWG